MASATSLTPSPCSAEHTERPSESSPAAAVPRSPPGPQPPTHPLRRPRAASFRQWPGLDAESRSWWEHLHASEPARGCAIVQIHERLHHEAAFHIRLRVRNLSEFPRSDIDDLAIQAADDALVALLRKLEDYRGESQFWTWARRFAALEAAVSIRRRLGHDHIVISRDPERLIEAPDLGCSVHDRVELRARVRTVCDLIADTLTPHQRTVLIAIAINGISTQTLADELNTTQGAIYKTLHDARRKLRAAVVS